MSTDLVVTPFDLLGADMRFGTTDAGVPFVVAADFARSLDYRDARDATRVLDEDEKGTQIVRTPGGSQQMTVIYEDGIWELIFLSRKPAAKALKKPVKSILRRLREESEGQAVPAPRAAMSPRELAELVIKEADRADAAEARAAELEPAADAWTSLYDAHGDYDVADAAKVLSRDPAIKVGRDRLFTILRDLKWLYRAADGRHRTYQTAIELGRLSEKPQSHYHPRTGELVWDPPQIRVTVKGLEFLLKHLKGSAPLAVAPARQEITR